MRLDLKLVALALAESTKTQEEIAKLAGMNPAHFSRVVNGYTKPNKSTIGRMAKALNVPITRIIKDE